MRIAELANALILAIPFCAGAADAQITGVPADSSVTDLTATSAPERASTLVAGSRETGEIVVTAQRKSERLADVPIAIVTQTSAQLERAGVANLRELTVVTPGLRFSGTGANAQPAIRGIHSDQTDPGNDANVAIYVDGVYQSNQLANNLDLVDVERVEVLKGPQGTLFGRNATGGAIRIFTREPTFDTKGFVDIGYGSFDDIYARGFIGGPVVGDSVAASLSGGYERSDSWLRDDGSRKRGVGLKSVTARGKLLFKPTDNLSILLIAAYQSRTDGNATAYQPLNGNTIARLFPGAKFPTRPYRYRSNPGPRLQSKQYTGSAKIDWEISEVGVFSSITAYNYVNGFYLTDADFSSMPLLNYRLFEKQSDISQEITFTSKKIGIIQVAAGVFFYDGDGKYDPLQVDGSFSNPSIYGFLRQRTTSLSGFGEVTITPIKRVSVIVGARYSHERRRASGSYFLLPDEPSSLPRLGAASFGEVTPRASVRYSLPSGDNVYLTYSRGFKSGGFNIAGLATKAYKPETVDAFELGLKTNARRAISANISAFIYNYRDQQVSSLVNGFNITANAAASRIYGVDADVSIRPVSTFTTTIGMSYLHARFKNFADAVFNVPSRLGGVVCACGNDTTVGDLSGGIEPFSPAFTIGITGHYLETFSIGTVDLSASLYSTSRFFYDNNARVEQSAYATLTARAGFKPANVPVTVYIWAKNLTDTRYFATTFVSNAGDGVAYAAPRTVGVGARVEF